VLEKSTNDPLSVTFCDLVEHPGGHDGGDFPQYHTFGLDDGGDLYYETDYPVTVNCDFDELPEEEFVAVSTKEEAVAYLKAELLKLEAAATATQQLLKAAEESSVGFTSYFGEEE